MTGELDAKFKNLKEIEMLFDDLKHFVDISAYAALVGNSSKSPCVSLHPCFAIKKDSGNQLHKGKGNYASIRRNFQEQVHKI